MNSKFTMVLVLSIIAVLFSANITVFADVAPPKKQLNADISIEDVICNEGFIVLIKISTGNPACVKPTTAEKLIKRGWAMTIAQGIIDAAKIQKNPIGTVNKLDVVKVTGTPSTQTPKVSIIGYDFVFEVCALDKKIYAPDVFIKSDSAAQHVELPNNIEPNECVISSTIIKAANPDTITATLVNKGGISEKISILESKITELSQKLDTEKKSLSEFAKQESKPADYKALVSESTKKISELRTELNDARADYSRFLFILYVTPSKASTPTKFTFSGVPIEGASATILSITQQVSGNGFNVVFEACAGEKAVVAPLVTVKSDIDSKDVVLAKRISPNTCQLGTGQLNATDQNSIQVMLDNTEEFSAKVGELETKIAQWQSELANEKRTLAEIVKVAQKPADYEMKVSELTKKITELRDMINSAKSSLQGSLFDFYQ
ncbi:MAG: hypothetical protein ACE5RN_08000 [Nitrosopumilaceae archaeon]